MLENFKKIVITMPNGRIAEYPPNDFELFGNELEHKSANSILNLTNPTTSFAYKLNEREEIANKEYMTRFEFQS